MEEEWKTI
uniref:(California timema) hypothetical protein n=1 Tax=Timema californicum TaxID=61474 RepID=A0A7R9P398_TIMCA|nr:unnamed protein product [Timema californicum]